ncbi:MAG: hypothetical protein WA624_17635 [Methylocella sp.]
MNAQNIGDLSRQVVEKIFDREVGLVQAGGQGYALGHVEGVPDKKALAGLKEAKRKLDELYREVMGRKGSVGARKNKAPRFAKNALVKNSRYLFFREQSTYLV